MYHAFKPLALAAIAASGFLILTGMAQANKKGA